VRACTHVQGHDICCKFFALNSSVATQCMIRSSYEKRFYNYSFFQITCFVRENKMAIQIYWFGYYRLWMLITNVQHHILISMSTNLVWHGKKINSERVPWVMLNYRPNGPKWLGRPLNELLGIGHSEDHAAWYILILKSTRCINFSNLFLE